jgi:hypothetical protein
MGIAKLRKGFLGEIKLGRNDVEAEIRGLMDRYTTEVVELYSQSCRADLGDDRCGIDLLEWTVSGTVSARTNDRVFNASALLPLSPIFTDQFNRANGGVGGNYTTLTASPAGGLTIVSNRVRGTTLAHNEAKYNVRTMPAKQYAQITLTTFGGTGVSVNLGLRLGAFTGAWNGYYARALVGGGYEIIKRTAGVAATLGSGAAAWANGDIMRFEVEGTTLRVYRNGTLAGSVTDSTYSAAGYASLAIQHTGGGNLADLEVDDYVIGAVITSVDNVYQGGLLTWTSGNNAGGRMEVRKYTEATKLLELVLPMPSTIQVGDTFSLQAGCDKSHTTCQSKYGNILNFRGEPFIPQNKAIGIAEGRSPESGGGKK